MSLMMTKNRYLRLEIFHLQLLLILVPTLNDLMNQVVENSQVLLRCNEVIAAVTAELKKLHTLETAETSN